MKIFSSNCNQELIKLLNNIVFLNYEKYRDNIQIWQDNLKITNDHYNELRDSDQITFQIRVNTFLKAMGLRYFTVPGTGILTMEI